jgi:hypothetical protein
VTHYNVDQMIMNLVVNARDAMPGGGKLTIETANVVLDENSMGHMGVGPGPFCLLAVGDTGVGMTPEIKSRLFEPFFTTKEAGKGTGLGLSIVYGIVKQNNGEITVYSEPGIGTTFKIYLPMAEGPVEFSAPEPSLTGLRGTESVLLCEDEAVIRRLVRSMLERQGYTVIEAETPRKAMEIARDQRWTIDLLLTDVVMPETSGVELAKFVQQVRPEIKVLYMSGYTDNRISGSWELDRSIAFLQKPFTAATLARKIRETLAV